MHFNILPHNPRRCSIVALLQIHKCPGLSLGSPIVSITIEYPDLQHCCRGGDKVGGEIVEAESNLDG